MATNAAGETAIPLFDLLRRYVQLSAALRTVAEPDPELAAQREALRHEMLARGFALPAEGTRHPARDAEHEC